MWLSSEKPPFSLTGGNATSVTSGSSARVVSMRPRVSEHAPPIKWSVTLRPSYIGNPS